MERHDAGNQTRWRVTDLPAVKARVLLVEDTQEDFLMVKAELDDSRGLGINVDWESGRANAQHYLNTNPTPDLVVIDVVLEDPHRPDNQGLVLLDWMRDSTDPAIRETPVVILSSYRIHEKLISQHFGQYHWAIWKPTNEALDRERFADLLHLAIRTGVLLSQARKNWWVKLRHAGRKAPQKDTGKQAVTFDILGMKVTLYGLMGMIAAVIFVAAAVLVVLALNGVLGT